MAAPQRSTGTELLTPEQHRAYVREFQTALRELSRYNLLIPRISVDGIYGPETAAAVAAFQGVHGLPVTGEVDPVTWNMIFFEYNRVQGVKAPAQFIEPFPSSSAVISLGAEGDVVVIIQLMLRAIGNYFKNMNDVEITGRFREKDAEAVRQVQNIAGLEETGGVDQNTWNTLVETYNHVNRIVPPAGRPPILPDPNSARSREP